MKLLLASLLVLIPLAVHAEYLGNLSANEFDPNSVANPFGAGNPYSLSSPTNPYGIGLRIEGRCDPAAEPQPGVSWLLDTSPRSA